jgi:flagellar protein FlbD
MIYVTRLNNTQFVINADIIKTIEANPDTVITLYNEEKYVVKDKVQDIVDKIVAFRRSLYEGLFSLRRETVANEKVK